MSKSRQVRRQEERQAAKKANTTWSLEAHCVQLASLVGEMQISLNTMYQLLIEKDHLTAEEFREKHKEIMLAMYPPKKPKCGCKEPAADCDCETEDAAA